jgi:DNA-binding PadR family transcriptional regulator
VDAAGGGDYTGWRKSTQLYYILKFLQKSSFVIHENIEGKPHWKITEKGKELLDVLSKS